MLIGASSAGMAAALSLKDRAVTPLIIEHTDMVASSWRSRYNRLRLNPARSPRTWSRLEAELNRAIRDGRRHRRGPQAFESTFRRNLRLASDGARRCRPLRQRACLEADEFRGSRKFVSKARVSVTGPDQPMYEVGGCLCEILRGCPLIGRLLLRGLVALGGLLQLGDHLVEVEAGGLLPWRELRERLQHRGDVGLRRDGHERVIE